MLGVLYGGTNSCTCSGKRKLKIKCTVKVQPKLELRPKLKLKLKLKLKEGAKHTPRAHPLQTRSLCKRNRMRTVSQFWRESTANSSLGFSD
jgi:hypothetical protein